MFLAENSDFFSEAVEGPEQTGDMTQMTLSTGPSGCQMEKTPGGTGRVAGRGGGGAQSCQDPPASVQMNKCTLHRSFTPCATHCPHGVTPFCSVT